jgi:hypothetical protein
MKRRFEEKREVTHTVSRTVCDICGEVVMDDKPFVRLYATDDYQPVSWDEALEVCTPDCLAKNIAGIKLILDGKMIPSAKISMSKKDRAEDCKEAPSYSKASQIIIPISIGR